MKNARYSIIDNRKRSVVWNGDVIGPLGSNLYLAGSQISNSRNDNITPEVSGVSTSSKKSMHPRQRAIKVFFKPEVATQSTSAQIEFNLTSLDSVFDNPKIAEELDKNITEQMLEVGEKSVVAEYSLESRY